MMSALFLERISQSVDAFGMKKETYNSSGVMKNGSDSPFTLSLERLTKHKESVSNNIVGGSNNQTSNQGVVGGY